MNGALTTEAQDPAAKEANTDDGGDRTNAKAGTGRDPSAAEPVSAELPPRRRGILLGTRPGAEAPAAADDAKSLAWMATQAVKALNAVKASQLEQAQALKARAETSQDERPLAWEEEGIALDAGESAGLPGGYVQTVPAPPLPLETAAVGQPGQVVRPIESPQEAVTVQRIPAVARGASAPRAPARLIVMLGILALIGWLGYRHWIAGDRTPSEVSAPTTAIIEPAGPVTGVELTAPPISVVAAPKSTAGHTEPAPAEVDTAPAHEPAAAAPAVVTTERNEPAAPATSPQAEAVAGNAPHPAQANPASAAMPAALPPAPAPDVAARQPASAPEVTASQPAAPAPVPEVTAKQPAPPAPAPRSQYPTNGYGYYPPPSSWQPYYRPAYPQTPARQ